MTVLVTGVNGFVGSNVALELLKSGYKVRGTVRGSNLESFKKAIGDKFPRLEVAQVDNVGTDDLTAVLRGKLADSTLTSRKTWID
ncbi:hypothetical protein DXG03_006932 [Asterophora parasitica]|uniref:NAD-dependent epimerase/dehydratase domain-containing protein n=1 Tax=Asterophora parasitica TaxID=117018 RepID=A0A9P7KC06_9AGAR|nr:hypothetical protein DXG03_006932 [Asterophora parasitica]